MLMKRDVLIKGVALYTPHRDLIVAPPLDLGVSPSTLAHPTTLVAMCCADYLPSADRFAPFLGHRAILPHAADTRPRDGRLCSMGAKGHDHPIRVTILQHRGRGPVGLRLKAFIAVEGYGRCRSVGRQTVSRLPRERLALATPRRGATLSCCAKRG